MSEKPKKSVLSLGYWKEAASEFKSIRSLVIAGICIALATVISSFYIPVGLNLRIYFTFIVVAFGGMTLGPVMGVAAGLAYDLVSFLIFPQGAFFPGYTLSTMLEFFIYGLFLYRARISVLRVSLMKLIINYAVHVGLGSLWSAMLYNKGYLYFAASSMVKNTILLPIEVIVILAMLKLMLPLMSKRGLMEQQDGNRIPLI